MALLTAEDFEIPILPGTALTDAKHGDIARAYSGKLRTDVLASHRVGHIVASIFDTANDAGALRAILNTPGPVLFGGSLIGDDAYFHVSNLVVSPITADRLKFDFDLAETDDSPSELLFSFDGDAPGTYTFTRSGAVGKYTDSAGVLQDAAANIARFDWLWIDNTGAIEVSPDTRSLLVDRTRINLVSSDDFSAGWTSAGTPVITTGVSDPAGGTAAYTIADDDVVVQEYKVRTLTFTGNAVKAVVFVVRFNTMASAGNQGLQLWDDTAGALRLQLDISAWSNGAPTVAASTGTYLGKRHIGNGYWALYAQSSLVTAANTNRLIVVPALTLTATGAIDVYRANAYNAVDPPLSILDASETMNYDLWYAAYTHVPQEVTHLIEFVDGMSPSYSGAYRVMQIGNVGGTGARFQIHRDSGSDSYVVQSFNRAGANVFSSVDINPAWGNRIRIRAVHFADGSVQIGAAKNTGSGYGAETVGTASAAQALDVGWGAVGGAAAAERLWLTHDVIPQIAHILSCKTVSGERTMAEMVDWAGARLWPRQV
jgi:hypothetical protein